MSTPERTDDPGEHGYGGVESDEPPHAESPSIRKQPEPNPSRRTRDDDETATNNSEPSER